MLIGGKKLKFVILHCPYTSLDQPKVQLLFAKTLALKISGYSREYPFGMLPIDTTDLFADQHMICEELPFGELEPLMVMKSTDVERCKVFRMEFPFIQYLKKNTPENFSKVLAEALESEEPRSCVTYESGLTTSNSIQSDPVLKKAIKDRFLAVHYFYHSQIATSSLRFAMTVSRFKVDKMFQFWGYEKARFQGEELQEVSLPSHFGHRAYMMFSREFSETARIHAEAFRFEWENRIELGERFDITLRKLAADQSKAA